MSIVVRACLRAAVGVANELRGKSDKEGDLRGSSLSSVAVTTTVDADCDVSVCEHKSYSTDTHITTKQQQMERTFPIASRGGVGGFLPKNRAGGEPVRSALRALIRSLNRCSKSCALVMSADLTSDGQTNIPVQKKRGRVTRGGQRTARKDMIMISVHSYLFA